ncbi:MAG: IMS domain-containing protein [Limnothrix sp.]
MTAQPLKNRYQILQELGQGGFGETFLAEDCHMPSHRRCVIKQLKPVTNDPAVYQVVKERFQREAITLERLGEGNRQIPSLYAYFTESGQFYLVQEWIEGETLSQTIERRGLWSSAEVNKLLVGLLPVLDFIHDQGIVHRDIKPDNIILRQSDQWPVLIDFGAVKETMGTQMNTAGNTTSSIVIGTPGFMSSEQAIGRPVFSSDLYSLGLTAIYLLTGKLPSDFHSDPMTGKILWRAGSENVSVDHHLANVLDQAICTHPRDRFANATAMLRALQAGDQRTVPMAIAVPPTIAPPQSQPVPYSEPTVVSTPNYVVPVSVPTPTVAAAPVTVPPYPPRGMADWQKAILTGGVIGAFLLGGVVISNQVFNNDRDPVITEVEKSKEESIEDQPIEEVVTNVAGNDLPPVEEPPVVEDSPPVVEQPPVEKPSVEQPPVVEPPKTKAPVTPKPTESTKPAAAIDKFGAEAVVVDWLKCKSELFDYPYKRNCGNSVLTGKAYDLNIERSDGELSSMEWLQVNDAYYVFENQSIKEISDFQMVGKTQAVVELVVSEKRTLYTANDKIDANASGSDQRLVRYNLRWTDNTWKIADYKTLEILQKN